LNGATITEGAGQLVDMLLDAPHNRGVVVLIYLKK